MATHHGCCIDEDGHFLEGAEIYVYAASGFLADILTEDGSPADQPLVAGKDGSFAYVAKKGEYRHSIWHAGRSRAVEYGVILSDGVRNDASLERDTKPVGDTFDVRDFGAVGDGIADDTSAIARAGAALQAAGGGRLLFPKGEYLIFGKGQGNSGNVLLFQKLSGVIIECSDAPIKVDPDKNWANTTASFVKFVDCHDCVVNAGDVTSPPVPIDGSFDGMEFVSLRGDCTNVRISAVRAKNLLAVLLASSPTTPAGSRDIHIGTLFAVNCVYAINCANSGSHIVIDNLIADGCGRSFFAYGISHAKARVHSRNFKYAADVVIAVINKGFNTITDFEFDYTNVDSVATNGGVAVAVGHSFANGVAGTITDVRVNLNVSLSGGMGSAFEYSKIDARGNPDTIDRGHILRGLQVTGIVRGTPQTSAPIQFGRNGTRFGAGDSISDIHLNGLYFVGTTGAAIEAFRIMPALKGAFYLRDISAPTDINIWGGGRVAAYAPVSGDAQVIISGVESSNLDGYNRKTDIHGLRRPALNVSPVEVLASYRELTLSNYGASETVIYNLPRARVGLAYEFIQEFGNYPMWIKPRGSDVFHGRQPGEALQIHNGGGCHSAAAIRCIDDGVWSVIRSNGPMNFEP